MTITDPTTSPETESREDFIRLLVEAANLIGSHAAPVPSLRDGRHVLRVYPATPPWQEDRVESAREVRRLAALPGASLAREDNGTFVVEVPTAAGVVEFAFLPYNVATERTVVAETTTWVLADEDVSA